MTKLNDTQLIILSAAAQRDDHGVAAIDDRPETLSAITKLLKAKLLKTITRTAGLAVWDSGEDGAKLSLMLSPAGLQAIGGEEGVKSPKVKSSAKPAGKAKTPVRAPTSTPANAKGPAAPLPVRAGTKLAAVIGLLRRAKGASVTEIMLATGWQAHSVRGAISGALKKKLKLNVVSEVTGEVRRYRIAG